MAAFRIFLILLIALVPFSNAGSAAADQPFKVLRLDVEGSISPAQSDLLGEAVKKSSRDDFGLLLIRLNTPGGLGQSMRDMVSAILNSPVPVAVWVAPPGARAASAGVFLVASADYAAMSPQTTIGAASPVSMGGKEMDETMAAKIENDILSLVRGVAESRGRNVEWYERAVTEADSITANEAVKNNVIDFVAEDVNDLLRQIATHGIGQGDRKISFDPARIDVVRYEPGVRYKVLSWLLDPQVAYILLLGGMAGLFFELTTPGVILPGVIGGICLLLGLYAMSVLPTNAAGLLLILFGLVLFILEIKVVSFGMLSVAGVVCFFVGSLILYDFEYGMTSLPLSTILGVTIGLALVVSAAVFLIVRAHRERPAQGLQALVGKRAEVRNWSNGKGQVFVRGEVWSAQSDAGKDFEPGESVEISAVRGLTLSVRQAETESKKDG
jgi:membrane-bound serine protease (ClpP class)